MLCDRRRHLKWIGLHVGALVVVGRDVLILGFMKRHDSSLIPLIDTIYQSSELSTETSV
jgi:hypothetical protein